MTAMPHDLTLLDTSALVHIARNDATGRQILVDWHLDARPDRPLISTITEGEILSIGKRRRWGQEKLDRLQDLLNEFVRVEAGLPQIVAA
ncbi:MAG: hypothetical protein KF774_07375 [Planctomyces sp.]|nr:hypothetical protein [Planctomyces sp.]